MNQEDFSSPHDDSAKQSEQDYVAAPKKRGLGRGLDALFGDDEDALSNISSKSAGQKSLLGIEQIVPNLLQPRKHFDQDALEELAESIKRYGLIQPIVVTEIDNRENEDPQEKYRIVAGERRWRAAQKAQLHEVPVIIVDYDEMKTFEVALVENLQREDLNPLEEAMGYKNLADQFGNSYEEIATSVGKSRSHVANMIRLLMLPPEVQEMLVQSKLSTGHARALLSCDNPIEIAKEVYEKGLSVRQTEALVNEIAGRNPKSTTRKTSGSSAKDADTIALENEVSNALGLKVTLNMKGKSSGFLNINFDNLDQLDDVLHRLSHYPGNKA